MNDKIASEIQAEQSHGRAKYGIGPDDFSHDDGHIASDWLDMIEDHRQRARFETPMEYRQRMIKIAGLAISAIESFDRHTFSNGTPHSFAFSSDLVKQSEANFAAQDNESLKRGWTKCKCLNEIGEKLKAQNLKLSDKHIGFMMPKFELALYFFLEWIDKTKAPKGKRTPPKMLVSFCPFCGQPTRKAEEIETEKCEHDVVFQPDEEGPNARGVPVCRKCHKEVN